MRTLLASALVLLMPAVVQADGLLYQLPEDGAWASFDLTLTFNPDRDNERTLEGWMKMSSVGTATENGEPCRWIEIKLTFNDGNQDRTLISKVLIPKEQLAEGKSPLEHIVRGWFKQPDDSEPQEINTENLNRTSLPVLLSGPLQDAEKLASAPVKSELGELECEGIRGSTTYRQGDNANTATLEVRKHEKAPFGVVSCRIENKINENNRVTATLTLSGHGTTALSDLPKYN